MEKSTEKKIKTLENETSGIKEARLKALKANYRPPEFNNIFLKEMDPGECSDMGSCMDCTVFSW